MSILKKIKQIITIAAISLFMTLSLFATDVTIGSRDQLSSAIPFSPDYNYSYSQTIYLQSEVKTSGTITEINYFYDGISSFTDSIEIFMGTTTRNDFATNNAWFSTSTDISKVFDGEFVVNSSDSWISILLDTPFNYDHTTNLVIAVHEKTPDFHTTSDHFFSAEASDRSLYYRDHTTDINPANPTPTPTTSSYMPYTRLVFDESTLPTLSADFTADLTSGQVPLTVNFTSLQIGNITQQYWDFDNEGLLATVHSTKTLQL